LGRDRLADLRNLPQCLIGMSPSAPSRPNELAPQADQQTDGREPNKNSDERSLPFWNCNACDRFVIVRGSRFCKTALMSSSSTIDSDGLLGLYRTATAFPFRSRTKSSAAGPAHRLPANHSPSRSPARSEVSGS